MLKTVSAIATQIISSITGGLVQFTGPAAGTTRVVTVPNANATMARTDAAQSFTGDQTLGTGDLIIGTSGKGITNSTGSVALDFSTAGTALTGGAQSVLTGSFNNVGTAQTVTITNTNGGFIVVTGVQGGIGSSTWTVPFAKRGGTVGVGTASKAFVSADPILSVAASGGDIVITPIAGNTYFTYAIYYTPLGT